MEGGTDFDLQVLEAPVAPAGGEASGSGGPGGEKTQADPSGAQASANASSEATGSRTEEAAGGETSETKDKAEKV